MCSTAVMSFIRKPASAASSSPPSRVFRAFLDFLSESIPEAKTAKPAQFFDDRFVRQVNSWQIASRIIVSKSRMDYCLMPVD